MLISLTVDFCHANVAHRRFGNLEHTRVVVIGCGKTGQSVARQVVKLGARDVVFINRNPARAKALEEICRRELTYAAGEELAGKTTERVVAKILARPMVKLRTALAHGEALWHSPRHLTRCMPIP